MSPFIKKEVRLLLPTFGFAVLLALVSVLFHDREGTWLNGIGYFMGCIFCPAIAVMLTLNTFGLEVGTHTFSMMLAQPVSRQRIWQTKILLLALALAAVGLVWYLSIVVPVLFFHGGIVPQNLVDVLSFAVIFGVSVYSGGLWTVLLLRQVAAAFWFTLIVPAALLGIVAGLFGDTSDEFTLGMAASVLGVYSVGGFFFARWLFFRAQDLQWTGGAIVMPEWRGLVRLKAAAGQLRRWRPRAALWRKEIQLHQSQYVIAFVLVVLHLGVLGMRKFYDLQHSRDLKFLLETFWVIWLAVPALAGCAAVAEERKLGTLESQLCLPIKQRKQFAIKLLVVLGLSVLFGALVPLLLEGNRILPGAKLDLSFLTVGAAPQISLGQAVFWTWLGTLNGCLPFLTLAGIVVLIGSVSFYTSTMTRNTLQTLGPAVLGIMLAFCVIFTAGLPWTKPYPFLWHGALAYFIAVPILALTVLAMAYYNFRRVLTNWQLAARNLATLAAALLVGVVLTSAVYHRFWQKFAPFESPHGAPKLFLSNPPDMSSIWSDAFVRLPDGKVWTASLKPDPASLNPRSLILGNFKTSLVNPQNMPGSNWLNVTYASGGFIGLKTDGTFWTYDHPRPPLWKRENQRGLGHDELNLVPFGGETNWTSFVSLGRLVLLTKNDGTLWRLGGVDSDSDNNHWAGLAAFAPRRLGTKSNWSKVFQGGFQICLQKKDGSTWAYGGDDWNTNIETNIQIEPGLTAHALPPFKRQVSSVTLISHGLQFMLAVCADGSFRILADQRLPAGHGSSYVWTPTDVPLGADTNWLALAGNWEQAVTLKNDGTLWLWNFQKPFRDWNPSVLESEVLETVPVRLGTHSDWIAITGAWNGGVTALAADGSLWFWPLSDPNSLLEAAGINFNQHGDENWLPLLDVSRKPQFLGNVFSQLN